MLYINVIVLEIHYNILTKIANDRKHIHFIKNIRFYLLSAECLHEMSYIYSKNIHQLNWYSAYHLLLLLTYQRFYCIATPMTQQIKL